MSETKKREQWASRIGLVLAIAGNEVGLGNFLRFPAQAAKNGGGAFLIPYIVALVLVGLPLIWVEWAMGRYGGQTGHHSTPGVFQAHHRNGFWKYFGVMGLWVCLIIASYYLYIETWCMAYAGYSAINGFAGKDLAGVKLFFGQLTGEREYELIAISWWGMVLFFLCIALNVFILSRGLAKGIEIVSKIGMPLLIVFAAVLAVRGMMISPSTDPGSCCQPHGRAELCLATTIHVACGSIGVAGRGRTDLLHVVDRNGNDPLLRVVFAREGRYRADGRHGRLDE